VFRSSVRVLCIAGSLASLAVLPLGAQDRSVRETKAVNGVPQSAEPPAGLCRVWLDNVPASQQPAPTDCATAIKNRPTNARIVFGRLAGESASAQQKATLQRSALRTSAWPNRAAESRPVDGAGGVRPVSARAPVIQPTADSGPKRRP